MIHQRLLHTLQRRLQRQSDALSLQRKRNTATAPRLVFAPSVIASEK